MWNSILCSKNKQKLTSTCIVYITNAIFFVTRKPLASHRLHIGALPLDPILRDLRRPCVESKNVFIIIIIIIIIIKWTFI